MNIKLDNGIGGLGLKIEKIPDNPDFTKKRTGGSCDPIVPERMYD